MTLTKYNRFWCPCSCIACKCCKEGTYTGSIQLTIGGVTNDGSNTCTDCAAAINGDYLFDLWPAEANCFDGADYSWPSSIYTDGDVFCAAIVGFIAVYYCPGWSPFEGSCTNSALYVFFNKTTGKRGFWFWSEWYWTRGGDDPVTTTLEGLYSEDATAPFDCATFTEKTMTVTGSIPKCEGSITMKVSHVA